MLILELVFVLIQTATERLQQRSTVRGASREGVMAAVLTFLIVATHMYARFVTDSLFA